MSELRSHREAAEEGITATLATLTALVKTNTPEESSAMAQIAQVYATLALTHATLAVGLENGPSTLRRHRHGTVGMSWTDWTDWAGE